jgi:DnaJ-domain-containing protein 1
MPVAGDAPAAAGHSPAAAHPPAGEGGASTDSRPARNFSIDDLERMDASEFQDLVADLFRESGYIAMKSNNEDDEEVNLVLSANGAKDLVRCGQRNAKLGLSTLHRFYISMMRARASHGFVLTTASFQQSAQAFARERGISLIDGAVLMEWIHGQPPPRLRAGLSLPFPDDPHAILGISRSATRKQIRQAYLALLKKYHPDRVAHLGEEFRAMAELRTQAINRAYEALLDNS